MKILLKKILSKLSALKPRDLPHKETINKESGINFKSILELNPLDANKHFEFAKQCLSKKLFNLAIAEFKTALSLGANNPRIQDLINTASSQVIQLNQIVHNQYYRFKTLSDKIKELANEDNYSVLDIGGGHGILSQFIPKANYCLVEPDVNGISGVDLPFGDKSFDFVVACHVLEHIPPTERELFLDQLCYKAKKAVILLNPFEINHAPIEERLQLFIEITNAKWAKEHLECGLPKIEDVINYIKKKGLTYSIKPNGSLTTTTAMVFVDYLANKSGCNVENYKISEFFNTSFSNILDNENIPTAYLITINTEK